MLVDDQGPRFAHGYAAEIRSGYWSGVRGDHDPRHLEALVRSLARDARAAGLAAERAIVELKLTVYGVLSAPIPLLVTDDDQREYGLFERMIGWVLDEYFGRSGTRGDGSERLAS